MDGSYNPGAVFCFVFEMCLDSSQNYQLLYVQQLFTLMSRDHSGKMIQQLNLYSFRMPLLGYQGAFVEKS